MKIIELVIAFLIACGSIGSLITALYSLKQAKHNAAAIDEVHVLTNEHADKQDRRIDNLHKELAKERDK